MHCQARSYARTPGPRGAPAVVGTGFAFLLSRRYQFHEMAQQTEMTMNTNHPTVPSPAELARLLVVYAPRWIVPAAVLGVLAALYAVFGPDTWEASQALVIRNEAVNNHVGPGKFGHTDEMKTVQETILELARSRNVLAGALREVGTPADFRGDSAAWPTDIAIETLRKNTSITPPKGAEFGTTEVFYLKVKDGSRDRAVALARAVCGRLEARFKALRDEKAQDMVDELLRTVAEANASLERSTAAVAEIERQVGGDLAELRALEHSGSDFSTLRQTAMQIRAELREADSADDVRRHLLVVLRSAQDDPGRLLAAPAALLESQPALRQLKEGLVETQIRTATLKGHMSEEHPVVKAAVETEEGIARNLHAELAIAIRSLEVEQRLGERQLAMLSEQLAATETRLDRLAELRATYAARLAEYQNRTAALARVEHHLAEARASHASANAASLITRLDDAQTGANPLGPTRAMIVLIGIGGGLLLGFAVMFLTVQPAGSEPAAQPVPAATPSDPAVHGSMPLDWPAANPVLSLKQALRKVAAGAA